MSFSVIVYDAHVVLSSLPIGILIGDIHNSWIKILMSIRNIGDWVQVVSNSNMLNIQSIVWGTATVKYTVCCITSVQSWFSFTLHGRILNFTSFRLEKSATDLLELSKTY